MQRFREFFLNSADLKLSGNQRLEMRLMIKKYRNLHYLTHRSTKSSYNFS